MGSHRLSDDAAFREQLLRFWDASLLVRASRSEVLGLPSRCPTNARMVLGIDILEARCINQRLSVSTIAELYRYFCDADQWGAMARAAQSCPSYARVSSRA